MKRFLLGVALVTGSVACTATGAELPPPVASMLSPDLVDEL